MIVALKTVILHNVYVMEDTYMDVTISKRGFLFLLIGQIAMIVSSFIFCFEFMNGQWIEGVIIAGYAGGILAGVIEVIGYFILQRNGTTNFKVAFWLALAYLVTLIILIILYATGVLGKDGTGTAYGIFGAVTAIINVVIIIDVLLGCVSLAPAIAPWFVRSVWAISIVLLISLFLRFFFPIIVYQQGGMTYAYDTWQPISNALGLAARIWYVVLLVKARNNAGISLNPEE